MTGRGEGQGSVGCLDGCLLLGEDGRIRSIGQRIAGALGLDGAREGMPLEEALAGRADLRPVLDAVRDIRPEDHCLLLALPAAGSVVYLSVSFSRMGGGMVIEQLAVAGGLIDLAVLIDSLGIALSTQERPQLALLDPWFRFLWANREYMLGSRKGWEELIGRDHFQLFPNEENRRIFSQARDTGRPVRYHAKEFEFADQPERGSTYWDWTLLPVRGPRGTVALLLTLVDVTPRIEMTRQLAERADQLVRSNKELSDFAYVASHDLREPLRMIAGYLELVERRLEEQRLDGSTRAYIRHAVEGAKRMDALINDLLAYSRARAPGGKLSEVELARAARTAVANLSSQMQGALVTIDPLPAVRADERQMEQLFQNLIGNALKYRAERPLEVRVSAYRGRDRWIIQVRDNGMGIAPEYCERIFEMFERLHGRGKYEGTGIGLAIARKIVERHGGRIWVESEEGKGSTFRFTLASRSPPPSLTPVSEG